MAIKTVKTSKRPAQARYKRQFSRGQILRELAYELKPFVIAVAGFASAIHFTNSENNLARFFSIALTVSGLVILYWRAKERGVIQ